MGDGAAVIFYEAGKKAVLVTVKRIDEEAKAEGEGELMIKVEKSFIAKEYGKSGVPVCHFLRGYCAGIGEALTNQERDAEEVKCVACGDDHCEFAIKMVE